jgi:1,4-dihydroxy-6-naphthoate synthase
VKEHAQAMDPEVMKQHIALYVNEFSEDLGDTGRNAIELMFREAAKQKLFNTCDVPLIIGES